MFHILTRLVVILFFPLIVTGCFGTTQPSKFYVLTSLADPYAVNCKEGLVQDIAIGIGPVKMPEYLKRPQIVTRTGNNTLYLSEFDRWAGSLTEDFTRVLAENISTMLVTDRIVIYPWRRSLPVDYQVEFDVIQLDGSPGGDVCLKVRWAVFSDNGKKLYFVKTSRISEATSGTGYKALVAAESRAIKKLSQEITTALKGQLNN